MTSREFEDPLVGNELIEVSFQPHHVHFTFAEAVLQLGVPFKVSTSRISVTEVDPEARSGDLHVLWSLVGKVVKAVIWDEKVSIIFADDEVISIGPCKGIRGTIMGRHDMTMEDF